MKHDISVQILLKQIINNKKITTFALQTQQRWKSELIQLGTPKQILNNTNLRSHQSFITRYNSTQCTS